MISVNPDGSRNSNLAFSKTRVRPLGKRLETLSEEMSICRLELLAALIAEKIGTFVKSAFETPIKMRFFSDSQVTLHRLKNNHSIYRPFVSNRLKQIMELTKVDEWFYIRTDENLAG